jgi:hypothetical protein
MILSHSQGVVNGEIWPNHCQISVTQHTKFNFKKINTLTREHLWCLKPTITAAIFWPVVQYQHWMIDGDDYGAVSGMNEWQEESKYTGKACPSAALSSIDRT